MDNKAQLQAVREQLSQLDNNNRDHLVDIERLKRQEIDLEQALAQEQAALVRIQDATEQAAYFLDSLVVEGFNMRDMCAGEAEYQLLRIAVQSKIISLAEEASEQISLIQTEENAEKLGLKQQISQLNEKYSGEDKRAAEDQETILQLQYQLAQAKRESIDYQGKLKNATDEIDRLNSQVDDLRKEIAVGARNAYKVTDVDQAAQIKQLAEQIKAARIHVYDVTPDNVINPKNYTGKRADDGTEVTWNWTQSKNYIEIKDEAEVERFREQFANQEAVSDSSLGNETPVNVTAEGPFPELPRAEAPEVPNITAVGPVVDTASTDIGQGGITKEEFESRIQQVKEEIKAEIVSQYGLVQMAS